MASTRRYYPMVVLAGCLQLALLYGPGCAKDYSYEGGQQDSAAGPVFAPGPDTAAAGLQFPPCSSCNGAAELALSRWAFRSGSDLLCGSITSGIANYERTALTFFGPSDCSDVTGLIVTAYLPQAALDTDRTGLSTDRVSFEYYDNTASTSIFRSWQPHRFSLTIDRYVHQTGMLRGQFTGYAFKSNGDSTLIRGRFAVQLR